MTARDEAIDAMVATEKAHGQEPYPDPYYGDLLDAIPADVLARLTIERGGLQAFWTAEPGTYYRLAEGIR